MTALSGPALLAWTGFTHTQPLPVPGTCQLSPASGLRSPPAWNTLPAELDRAGSGVWEPVVKYSGILQAG